MTATSLQPRSEHLGVPFLLLLIYLVMEYARPANPMGIPLIISILLFISWLLLKEKLWSAQILCFFLLLATIAAMGPFAINTFSIWWGFRAMAVQLLCICIPMIHYVTSIRKLNLFVYVLIGVYAYLSVYALLHGGVGPGGHVGDENDVALAINTAIPLTFVSIFLARSLFQRILLGSTFALMVLCVIATFSRGGFLGLIPVLLYCYLLSPRKVATTFLGLSIALLLFTATPQKYGMSYSQRISSIISEASGEEKGTGELRREHWAIAREMFYRNPLLGIGFKNYNWNVPVYQTEEQYQRIGRDLGGFAAHSLYFTVLAELGACGLLIFGAIIWFNLKDLRWIIRVSRRNAARPDTLTASSMTPMDPNLREGSMYAKYYAHAILAGFVGYLVSGIFLSVFDYPHFWLLTALLGGLKQATASLVVRPLSYAKASGEI